MTLWMADAAILVFGALVWAMLGGFYRIAPRAAALFCAGQFLALPSLPCDGCGAPWPGIWLPVWMPALLSLLSLTMVAAGVRRLLRVPVQRRHNLLAAALAGATALSGLLGTTELTMQIAQGAVALVTAFAGVLLLRGTADAREHRLGRLALCLPFLLMTLTASLVALRGTTLHAQGTVGQLLPLALHLWIPLSLMVLAVHRLWLRIDHLARHDPLTGALNRRALKDVLGQAQARLRRGQPFAWIALDIDHFKRINDELGHAAGDAALRHVAELLRTECRGVDAVARLGGEEFGVLLAGGDLDAATALAERLRQRFHEKPLQWQGRSWPMAASFGVTQARPGDAEDEGSEALLQRTDALLYRAKTNGRDCVIRDGDGGGA
jgi:diguanylate cyclase (GGDEF)-like protein